MAISLASIRNELLPGLARESYKSELREVLRGQQLTRRAIADNLYLAEFKPAPAFSPPIVDHTTIDLSAPVAKTPSMSWPPKVDLLID